MLKVTNKQYEVEEKIQLTKEINGKEEIIYQFMMQITESEMQEIKHILFDFANNNIFEYLKASKEQQAEYEKIANQEIESNNERIIDICFKEHKEKFRELAGEYKFEELLGEIRGYLLGFFMKKQISQLNIPITDLTKIMNNLTKYK